MLLLCLGRSRVSEDSRRLALECLVELRLGQVGPRQLVPADDVQQRAAAERVVLGPRGVLLPRRSLRARVPLAVRSVAIVPHGVLSDLLTVLVSCPRFLSLAPRQSQLASTLQKRTKRIVGARSLLIHHGLPPSFTSKKLRAVLREYFPVGIDEVTVIDDLTEVHAILHRRRALADALERTRLLDAAFEHGTMSWNLLLCPGSVLVPSPLDVLESYLCCKPCQYVWRHEQVSDCVCPAHRRRLRPHYSSVKSDREILDPRARSTIQSLDEQLDFFPEDAIRVYNQRQCMGAAFIVFESTAKRHAFVRLVNAHSCFGRVMNALDSCTWTPQGSTEDAASEPTAPTSADTSDLAPYLSQLVLESAPEPDDIIWENLKYRPYSVAGVVGFLARQVTTIALLLLFSTPTAVLVYVKLDSSSAFYKDLEAHHTFVVTLLVSYLPSLLLVRGVSSDRTRSCLSIDPSLSYTHSCD